MARPHLPTAAAGFLGVALNVLAVVALQPISHTYRPGDVPAWLAETIANPGATTTSAWAFTVGLVALAAFCAGLAFALKTPGVVVGAAFFGLGALLDAAGTMGPLAALHVEPATGLGLLWMALLVDSAFNGLLGVGLIAIAVGLPKGWSRWNRGLAAIAGVVSLPVGLQFQGDQFARLLAVSGPLWITWVMWTCVILVRPLPDPLPRGERET